jgi:hypothetical protein
MASLWGAIAADMGRVAPGHGKRAAAASPLRKGPHVLPRQDPRSRLASGVLSVLRCPGRRRFDLDGLASAVASDGVPVVARELVPGLLPIGFVCAEARIALRDQGLRCRSLRGGRDRAGSRETRRGCMRAGGLRLVMLTGDGTASASDVAARLDIDELHAELLPEDKLRIVQALKQQGRRVLLFRRRDQRRPSAGRGASRGRAPERDRGRYGDSGRGPDDQRTTRQRWARRCTRAGGVSGSSCSTSVARSWSTSSGSASRPSG